MWEIRLCLALGKTPAELRAGLGPGDLNLFRAIAQIDGPWWGERDDALAASVCHTIAGVAAAQAGKDAPPFHRFRIRWGEADKPNLITWSEAAEILRAASHQPKAV